MTSGEWMGTTGFGDATSGVLIVISSSSGDDDDILIGEDGDDDDDELLGDDDDISDPAPCNIAPFSIE